MPLSDSKLRSVAYAKDVVIVTRVLKLVAQTRHRLLLNTPIAQSGVAGPLMGVFGVARADGRRLIGSHPGADTARRQWCINLSRVPAGVVGQVSVPGKHHLRERIQRIVSNDITHPVVFEP